MYVRYLHMAFHPPMLDNNECQQLRIYLSENLFDWHNFLFIVFEYVEISLSQGIARQEDVIFVFIVSIVL